MPAHRVADHLDERIHVGVVELPGQPRCRVRVAHERPRDRGVEAAFDPVVELVPVEREEVRALLALDVDHLDELARLDLVAASRGPVDPEVQPRFGERRWELDLLAACAAGRDAPRRRGRSAGERRPPPARPVRPRSARSPGPPGTTARSRAGTTRRRAGSPSRGSGPARGRRGPARPPARRRPSRRRAHGAPSRVRRPARRSRRPHPVPSGDSTVSSATWPPSTSITVNRSSGAIAMTVAAAGPDPVLLERRVGRAEPSDEELRRAAADRHRA